MELLEWVENSKKTSRKKLIEMKYFDLCFVGTLCLLALIFSVLYVLMSKTVYFWDDSTYWDIGRMLADKPLNFGFIKDVYNSAGTSDYNYFVAVPVSLWMKIFGITRVSYIVAVFAFYLMPAYMFIYLIAKKMCQKPLFACVITLLMLPSMWYITVIGFIDVAGVVVALGCYYLYMTKVLNSRKYLKYILLGVMLAFIMIIRRYFAFFTVSFVTVMIIETILFSRKFKELFITLLSLGFVLVVLFYPFFTNILLKDYGALYSSYKYSFATDLKLITRYFGLVTLLLILSGTVYVAVKNKEKRGFLVLGQLLICAIMFVSTQTHGQQHLLLYVPGMTVMLIFIANSATKRKLILLLCIISLVNTISPCINRKQPQNIQEIKALSMFPTYSVKPKKRTDINSVLALKRTLDKKIPEGATCGVLASSFVLNSSILINVVPSLNMKENREDNYIVGLPEVDSRDYWRLNELYECDYILVATPAQTHLAPGEQTIITRAVESFKNKTDIAMAFSEISDFDMKIGSIDIRLYKKISNITETAKTEFELKLYK